MTPRTPMTSGARSTSGSPATSGASVAELTAVEWSAAGARVLGPIDLRVRAGECLMVVGPNGAGKTTLLRLLAGVLDPSRGSVLWGGREMRQLGRRALARRIAYVPQVRPARVPLTVGELVLQGRYPHFRRFQVGPAAEDLAAVERALDRVGIGRLRDRPLDELSGGERQAAWIAAALAQEAEILVLDEPTTHLDPRHQREVVNLVGRLRHDSSGTVVAATHDLNFAYHLADRIVALADGRILACEGPEEFVSRGRATELFGAPFEVVRGGARPVTVLELGS